MEAINAQRRANIKRLRMVKKTGFASSTVVTEKVEPKKTLWQRIKLFFSWSK